MKSAKSCLVAMTAGLALMTMSSTVFAAGTAIGRAVAPDNISPARAQALTACSALENQYKEYTWGIQESSIYRECMAQHGQPE
jgi:hypothetical protein